MKVIRILMSLFVVVLIITSCKKEEEIHIPAKLLPSKIIGNEVDYTITFTYNSDNMITDCICNYGYYDAIYSIEYSNNKPSYISENWDGETSSYNITYSNDSKTVYITDTRNTTNQIATNFVLTLDDTGNLIKEQVLSPIENDDSERTYEYDALNNWVQFTWGGCTMQYDTTKDGIFVYSSTPSWVYVFFNNCFGEGTFSPHNLLVSRGNIWNSNIDYTYNWTAYNDDGFPELLTVTDVEDNSTFNYQISYVEAK